jgi:hypothetical protein
VLYQLCTGLLPFAGRDTLAVLTALATHDPEPPRRIDPTIPAAFSDLIMRLLAKNPDQRPRSAREVVEVIARVERALAEGKPVAADPAAPVRRVKKKVEPACEVTTVVEGEEVVEVKQEPRRKEAAEGTLRPLIPRKERRSGRRQRQSNLTRLAVIALFVLFGLVILVVSGLLVVKLLPE